MSSHAALTHTAEEMFETEWQRCVAKTCGPVDSDGPDALRPDPSVGISVLRELVGLLEESHDRPVRELVPTIRLLILEHEFTDHAGDSAGNLSLQERVDELVELFVNLLEKLRQQAITRGEWSELPASPQMFG